MASHYVNFPSAQQGQQSIPAFAPQAMNPTSQAAPYGYSQVGQQQPMYAQPMVGQPQGGVYASSSPPIAPGSQGWAPCFDLLIPHRTYLNLHTAYTQIRLPDGSTSYAPVVAQMIDGKMQYVTTATSPMSRPLQAQVTGYSAPAPQVRVLSLAIYSRSLILM